MTTSRTSRRNPEIYRPQREGALSRDEARSLGRYPATIEVTLKAVDPVKQSALIAKLANIAPADR